MMAPAVVTLESPDAVSYSGNVLSPVTFDFGDGTSIRGYNATHVYDKLGTFTTSTGKVITVQPDTRKSIKVGSDGITLAAAIPQLGDNTELLFKRGENFVFSQPINITWKNFRVADYGTGNNVPTLVTPGETFVSTNTASGTVIENLNFDSPTPTNLNKDGAGVAFRSGGTNECIRNCYITNICDFVNCNFLPNGLLVTGNQTTSETSIRGYLVWTQGTNVTIINNTCLNVTREHVIRVGGCHHLNIGVNTLQNLNRQNVDPQDTEKGCLVLQKGDYFYVGGNTIRVGGLGVGPLGGADGVGDASARAKNVFLENNIAYNTSMGVSAGSEGVMFSQNSVQGPAIGYNIVATDKASPAYADRTIRNLTFDGNKYQTDGQFVRCFAVAGTFPDGIQVTFKNNAMIAPNLFTGANQASCFYAEEPDISHFSFQNNRWQIPKQVTWVGGEMYVFPTWSDPSGYLSAAQWTALPQVRGDSFVK